MVKNIKVPTDMKKEKEDLDKLLKSICTYDNVPMNSMNDVNKTLCYKLNGYGLCQIVPETNYRWEDTTYIIPTDKGKEFYKNGGFEGEEEDKEKSEKRIKWTNIRSWIAIILSAIAIIVAILK